MMFAMIIRTKIIATIGPASGDLKTLRKLLRAGVDVCRVNFSHGTPEQHEELLANIRTAEAELGEPVAVMADLCGPKIRVGPIRGGSMLLAKGQELRIVREPVEGGPEGISTSLPEMIDEVEPGEAILMDDGKLRLEVVQVRAPKEIVCKVTRGGILSSGKGVNLPQTKLTLSALTEKDRADVKFIGKACRARKRAGFDYVALSFVRSPEDVEELRKLLRAEKCDAHIVAKIEKPQAVQRIRKITDAADAIMVARGDLGVEMDLPTVPIAQKRIARLCQEASKPCIIATQMLETMTENATPTRAEVSDVANAVLDRTDAVMLSGETAVGKYPVRAVEMMNEIVSAIQAYHDEDEQMQRRRHGTEDAEQDAIAYAVQELIRCRKVAAVAVFTVTGGTARILAKHRLPCPILALSPSDAAVRRMCLYYGVAAAQQAEPPRHTRGILAMAGEMARKKRLARKGQHIVVISGRPIGQPGSTNTIVVHRVE